MSWKNLITKVIYKDLKELKEKVTWIDRSGRRKSKHKTPGKEESETMTMISNKTTAE